jgi:hypothetical protein
MALKNWGRSIVSKELIQYDQQKSPWELAITNFGEGKKWTIIHKMWGRDIKNLKTDLTKSQALKFAKNYMRRH